MNFGSGPEISGQLTRVQAMLDVEAALARAEASCKLIPDTAVTAIEAACDVTHYDLTTLAEQAGLAGNLAIPLVKMLTAQVALADVEASRFVHLGSTSQDIIDTGMVLQCRQALLLLDTVLTQSIDALETLVRTHRRSVMPARTWLQQAVPITFGLKAAGWLDSLLRARTRLRTIQPDVLALQFGGAAGSLAALDKDGPRVAIALGADLQLALPDLPWHTQRDRMAELGAALGLLVGVLGKIARDISLLMQSEIGEAFEPALPGRGGSTAMPHKRNPVACSVAIAAAIRVPALISTLFTAMPQEHERGLGNWPTEWEVLPQIFCLAAGSLHQMTPVLARLEVNVDVMRAHCQDHGGMMFAEAVSVALAGYMGKSEAHACVEKACRTALAENRHLQDVLSENSSVASHLDATTMATLFDPERVLGANDHFIDAVLARAKNA